MHFNHLAYKVETVTCARTDFSGFAGTEALFKNQLCLFWWNMLACGKDVELYAV